MNQENIAVTTARVEHNGVDGFWYKYPHPAVTTDCVIFGYDAVNGTLKVLLIERGIDPHKGKWALPGGFINPSETTDECARRELKEETGLSDAFLEQFRSYSTPDRDPRERVITIAYLALVRMQDVVGGDDAASARWFDINDVPSLAFDHKDILWDAREYLRVRIHFKPIGFDLLPEKFTMRQLQTLYEAILGVQFDRRNFAKKMLHFDMLTQLDEKANPSHKREAILYSFNKESYDTLKRKGFRLEF
ncbi:MAG: NUDIX hydrolase [Bacteroidales bacterium]|nr:NUDIX hydrolase [Candidatus Sodaliphilus limicaballi]